MPSFSETNSPGHTPAGPEIPSGVRRALLDWFGEHDVEPREIWRLLNREVGWGSPQDVVDDVAERFGSEAAERVSIALKEEAKIRRPVSWDHMPRYTSSGLDTVPAALFLDALEIGVGLSAKEYKSWSDGTVDYIEFFKDAAIEEINRLFAVRGIEYRFGEDGKAMWHGDEGAYREVIAPALAALADVRFKGAQQEFGDALVALRQGTRVGHKNAIRDASNAVESAMKSLLDEHGVPRTGQEAAQQLSALLLSAEIVAANTQDTICAAPRLRNKYGGHGPNPKPTAVPIGIPDLTVQAAATALTYLSRLFP
jgi:hypothetical protein